MNAGDFDLALVAQAFVAGLLVLATHVPLGRQVLERGIIFIDLAIAQMAALGVIVAHALGFTADGWALQAFAAGSAVGAALVLYGLERYFVGVHEAVIGAAFVLAASAGILVLATDVSGGEALRDSLAGQILWVSWEELLPAAVATVVLLVAWFSARSPSSLRFYLVFALAVTVSVQLVGVYLVFASLILPALATRRIPARAAARWALVIGALGYLAGVWTSIVTDAPTGPTIVWMLALVAVLLAPLAGATTRNEA